MSGCVRIRICTAVKSPPTPITYVALVLVISAVAVFIGSLVMITNISGTLTPVQSNGEVTADLKTDTLYALYSEEIGRAHV